MFTKTDNDDYVTTFEYNKLGQQTKSKNYLNVETVSEYDNWGKLKTSTTTGASTAVQTNDLFGMHITISEINLYDPVGLYGGGDLVFKYPNVMKVNNYYQRNPVDGILILADNPFIGSPVSGNFQFPEINNVNYTGKFYSTGVLMSHLNITKYAINNP